MGLSEQNKLFLSQLNKLDIDLKQFPDMTFDGLFDNVTESMNFFLNWFVDNITQDNTLTSIEEGMYFEIEENGWLASEEEMEYFLTNFKPTYEELLSLDVNYVNAFLSQVLEDFEKSSKSLNIHYENLKCVKELFVCL